MSWLKTTKAKVISVGGFLAGVAAIAAFFNVDIPKNAYISDVQASEQRQQRQLSLSEADRLIFEAKFVRNEIKALNRELAVMEVKLESIVQAGQTPSVYLTKAAADLRNDIVGYRAELKHIQELLKTTKQQGN